MTDAPEVIPVDQVEVSTIGDVANCYDISFQDATNYHVHCRCVQPIAKATLPLVSSAARWWDTGGDT